MRIFRLSCRCLGMETSTLVIICAITIGICTISEGYAFGTELYHVYPSYQLSHSSFKEAESSSSYVDDEEDSAVPNPKPHPVPKPEPEPAPNSEPNLEPKEGRQSWSYVNIRKGAYMFWWLYYTTGVNPSSYTQRPLVMWLQGGPGVSSTGYGNFMEIGPLNVKQKDRNNTWVKYCNILFVDSPVGTGYSYVQNTSYLPKNNTEIANDLVLFMKGFLEKAPEFKSVPFFVFSESYGAKMAVQFAKALTKAIESKTLECAIKGVVLGNPWISPVDSVLTWGPFLYSTSLVDTGGMEAINNSAYTVQSAVDAKEWKNATKHLNDTENVVLKYTNNVNFYNILLKQNTAAGTKVKHKFKKTYMEQLYNKYVASLQTDELYNLMNGPIRNKLRVIPKNVTWGGQSGDVFETLEEDFMKPVTDLVSFLLNETALYIVVYNGQLDLKVDTPGTLRWIQSLKWPGLKKWENAVRVPLGVPEDNTAAFVKYYKNFTFYWVMKAGHMIPIDRPDTAVMLLKKICSIK